MLFKHMLGVAVLQLGLVAAAQAQMPAQAAPTDAQRAERSLLVDAAKAEGQVSYVEAVFAPETVTELADKFRAAYGLPGSFKINYTHANTSEIVTRLEQQIGAGRKDADVVGLAVPSWAFQQVQKGNILRYASPEYAQYGQVFARGLGKPDYFAMNGAYFFVPTWDASRLDFHGTSWNDIVGAVPPGRANMGNAETSLANLVTFMGVQSVMGPDFYKKVASTLKPQIIQAGELAHDRVLSGQDLFSLYGQATHVKRRDDLGGKLKMMLPREGLVLLPQELFIMASAPHPAASKLWLDFLLSADGQKIIVEREALVSGRDGAASAMADYPLTLGALKTIDIKWETLSAEELAKVRAEWTRIFR